MPSGHYKMRCLVLCLRLICHPFSAISESTYHGDDLQLYATFLGALYAPFLGAITLRGAITLQAAIRLHAAIALHAAITLHEREVHPVRPSTQHSWRHLQHTSTHLPQCPSPGAHLAVLRSSAWHYRARRMAVFNPACLQRLPPSLLRPGTNDSVCGAAVSAF
jgi:hypothetical protein